MNLKHFRILKENEQMKKVLVIGNKPYYNLCLNSVIDSFDTNIRCNFGLPHRKNGTKYDKLGVSSHAYQNLISHKLSRDAFVKNYGRNYKEDFIGHYYDSFEEEHKPQYKEIFHAQYKPFVHNKWLVEQGCPYRFTNIPTTGLTLILENLLKQNKVFIVFFSLIYDNHRRSHDTHPNIAEGCHSLHDETNILMWLHEEGLIDATLCMLEDKKTPTLNCKDLKPSEFILNLLKKEHGDIIKVE